MQVFGSAPAALATFDHSVQLGAGAGEVFTQEGVPGQRLYVTSLEIFVATAVTVNQIIALITDKGTGEVKWREVIAAGSAPGTRVGWIRDTRPLQLSVGGDYELTVPAPGGACTLVVNTDGFAAVAV